MTTTQPPWLDRHLGRITMRLLGHLGNRAADRGDTHEALHIAAALAVGSTGPRSHSDCCLPDVAASVDAIRARVIPASTGTFSSMVTNLDHPHPTSPPLERQDLR